MRNPLDGINIDELLSMGPKQAKLLGLGPKQIRLLGQSLTLDHEANRFFHSLAYSRAITFHLCHASGEIPFFSMVYGQCVEAAVCHCVDLLTQYLLARHKSITPARRRQIIDEALRFSSRWTDWSTAGHWVATSLGKFRIGDVPEDFRAMFMDFVKKDQAHLQELADHRITVRCLLSGLPSRSTPRQDLLKGLIARIKAANPRISQRKICAKLDAFNDRSRDSVPLPESWKGSGARSWCSALESPKLKNRVKKYLSEVKPGLPRPLASRR